MWIYSFYISKTKLNQRIEIHNTCYCNYVIIVSGYVLLLFTDCLCTRTEAVYLTQKCDSKKLYVHVAWYQVNSLSDIHHCVVCFLFKGRIQCQLVISIHASNATLRWWMWAIWVMVAYYYNWWDISPFETVDTQQNGVRSSRAMDSIHITYCDWFGLKHIHYCVISM